MADDLLYLIFCYNGKDPVEHGALIKRENASYYRCAKTYSWVKDPEMCKYYYMEADMTEVISKERAEEILKEWEPGWKNRE